MDKAISALTGIDSLSSDRLKTEPKKESLGQEQFLELMLTQLKNQDPLNPTESGEFLSQIAQFGTVNGITELKQSFNTLASSLQSNQALQASTMVGRSVLVEENTLAVNGSNGGRFSVDLPVGASQVQIAIEDEFGQLVQQFNLGPQSPGLVDVAWDGLSAQGETAPDGRYVLRASAVIDGENQAVSTLVQAPVESVSLSRDGGEPILNIANIGGLSLSAIRRVL